MLPIVLLHATQDIEKQMGRKVKGVYQDRPIDIDLLLVYPDRERIFGLDNTIQVDMPELTIPHPLMRERDFVMTPLREILYDPYEMAFEYAMRTSRSVFLTGKAGTGKTTFLRRLRRECPKQMVVVAPTGVAAINADGVTIHSLFQLPPQLFLPTDEARAALFREMQMRGNKQQLLQSLELLIIDEVSMVRADVLDAVDTVLRHFRKRKNQAFGGVQVLMIGDLHQLSPVAKEEEWQILRPYYQGPYFFQSLVFEQINPICIEFDHVYRQEDAEFVKLLNDVRCNCLSAESYEQLNSRYIPDWKQSKDEPYHIVLSTHNRKVDAINQREIEALKGREYSFYATIKGVFPDTMYPMEDELVLKKGARVMFIRNDSSSEKAYYNGLIGVVYSIEDEHIVVACDQEGGKEYIDVHKETWENIRYTTQNGSEQIEAEIIGRFVHYPLRLAWAVTIHKAQGLTFNHVAIDAEDAFASGQVYVALSRCRTLNGIVLLSPIRKSSLLNSREVLQFTDRLPEPKEIQMCFSDSERQYLIQLLTGLYDLRDALVVAERVSKKLVGQIGDLQPVMENFQRQLISILSKQIVDENYLKQRLVAAARYFNDKLQQVFVTLNDKPKKILAMFLDTDSMETKEEAKEKKELKERLYKLLHRKLYMMNHIGDLPSIDGWFRIQQTYRVSEKSVSKQSTSNNEKKKKVRKKT